ncbi:Crp/Fnr family transcriptional regulator [Gottschalkiaceae bacterium SANA]|nr:Crp/Fnr family transcriptional regulator [Gottschalkiaceae bacterium SANA]
MPKNDMRNILFDENLQQEMSEFYLENLAPLGIRRRFNKGEIIHPASADEIYIVLSGYFKQVLINQNGKECSLFRLKRGTIFGEMDYFDGTPTIMITKVLENSEAACVSREILEEVLEKYPILYRHFIHSITRKYRILMLKSARTILLDVKARISDTLLEITAQHGNDTREPSTIEYVYTHQELADAVGCSRVTITNVLKELKEEGYIIYDGRCFRLLDPIGLRKLTDMYW